MRMGWPGFLIRGEFLLAALLVGTLSAAAEGQTDLIAKGEKVYSEKKCSICHMVKGKGGKTASDLSMVGANRDAQWLKAFLKGPKAMNPKAAKMLPFRGSDEELEALVAYLGTLK